ncbi:MAG: hypothetical protein NTZ68_03970 [Candidatus Dependentiae bacterium]|nr:hypothetical protein [Candidatus Dependentiae bacterium]
MKKIYFLIIALVFVQVYQSLIPSVGSPARTVQVSRPIATSTKTYKQQAQDALDDVLNVEIDYFSQQPQKDSLVYSDSDDEIDVSEDSDIGVAVSEFEEEGEESEESQIQAAIKRIEEIHKRLTIENLRYAEIMQKIHSLDMKMKMLIKQRREYDYDNKIKKLEEMVKELSLARKNIDEIDQIHKQISDLKKSEYVLTDEIIKISDAKRILTRESRRLGDLIIRLESDRDELQNEVFDRIKNLN